MVSDMPSHDSHMHFSCAVTNYTREAVFDVIHIKNNCFFYYSVPSELNGVMLVGSMCMCSFVCQCVTHKIYDYVPRTNGLHAYLVNMHIMHVDKIRSHANFHPNHQHT